MTDDIAKENWQRGKNKNMVNNSEKTPIEKKEQSAK